MQSHHSNDASRPVMVAGGAGFIGSNLVQRLVAEGNRVLVVDDLTTGSLANLEDVRRRAPGLLEFHRFGLDSDAVPELMGRARPHLVYHCATGGPGGDDDVHVARSTVVGTVNLLRGCRAAGTRKVVVASSAMHLHGQVDPDELPVDETAPVLPVTAHGAALASIEHWLHAWQVRHGLDWTVVALASTYGPRQEPDAGQGEVAAMVGSMLAETDVTIAGDGEASRDLVFIDDVVHAFVLAAERGSARRYGIGTGQRTTLNRLFRALAAATRFSLEPIRVPATVEAIEHTAVDSSLAARELGWKPWTTLEEGLAATLQWWAQRR